MNLQNGLARLMIALWWLLWPVSAVLWGFFAYLYFASNGAMLIFISAFSIYYAFRLMWVEHENVATELLNSPFNTLFIWIILLLTPFIIEVMGLIQYGDKTRNWELLNWVIVGFFAAICLIWWVISGFFVSKDRDSFKS